MATSSSSSSPMPTADTDYVKHDLVNQIRRHEVAIAELNCISASRPVYQKDGNIFFRTTAQKATTLAQREIDTVKRKLEKLN